MITKEIKIINKSSKSRNLQILPVSSPFFEFFFNKKSKVAPGMHETVAIRFIPNAYTYFSCQLRLKFQNDSRKNEKLPQICMKSFGDSLKPISFKSKKFDCSNSKFTGEFKSSNQTEISIVPVEAFPKMILSTKKNYLPKIIGKYYNQMTLKFFS